MTMNNEPEAADVLAALPEVTPAELAALHDRLAARADAGDLMDVAYRTIDSPVGPLLLAATPQGLLRVAYESEDHDQVLATLAERVSPRILNAPRRLDPAARELDEYFAGARRRFDLPLDRSLSHGFRLTVLSHLPDIGYGQTASYGAVAALAGRPRAARAVGTACATNPLPVVVPCHRVILGDGQIGAYVGGPAAKRLLLGLEAAA
ncbi:MAG TPA: methylated-DNA--[protein]-cysteine S-methyltransferase [Streptosporangiaceae bacterium]|nr:methylated-DNA--[protein]-cysteine S-methyltransferase [Streptosporangiaceae bacterium]